MQRRLTNEEIEKIEYKEFQDHCRGKMMVGYLNVEEVVCLAEWDEVKKCPYASYWINVGNDE